MELKAYFTLGAQLANRKWTVSFMDWSIGWILVGKWKACQEYFLFKRQIQYLLSVKNSTPNTGQLSRQK